MSSSRKPEPVRVGLVTGEPIRMEGITSVFEELPGEGSPLLLPVFGSMPELLATAALKYMVVDMNSASYDLATLESIRRARPDLRLIVIGPEGNDELVMDAIIAGARAYLDSTAGPQMVRQAIEVVLTGSIWAPRRLLSKLIDRLLASRCQPYLRPAAPNRPRAPGPGTNSEARSNREIAKHLGIEERTVKAHVGRLMRKTGADNRIELSMRALHHSLLPSAGDSE